MPYSANVLYALYRAVLQDALDMAEEFERNFHILTPNERAMGLQRIVLQKWFVERMRPVV